MNLLFLLHNQTNQQAITKANCSSFLLSIYILLYNRPYFSTVINHHIQIIIIIIIP